MIKDGDEISSRPPRLSASLVQGSYFTVLPAQSFEGITPKWYAGDIYAMERAFPRVIELPASESGEYQLFVAGDYEVKAASFISLL